MSTDPIADLLTKIRNAGMARKKLVEVPYSKIKEELVKIFKNEGFIEDYKVEDDTIRVYLTYIKKDFAILGIKRISKPGLRRYSGAKELPRDKFKFMILSTPQGLMTDKEAKKKNVGGEVICQIW